MTETIQLTLFELNALDKWFQENTDKTRSEETKAKMRAAWTPKRKAEHSVKMRVAITGENNPMKQPETRARNSVALTGRTRSERAKAKQSAAMLGHSVSRTTKAKISATMIGKYMGENSPNWQGGKSFEPYCSRFNHQLKEQVRNRDNRTCILCGKGEIQNGERLTVHHIDGDKMQGCNGTKWYLCALCRSCNSKPDTFEKEFLIVSNLRFLES